MEIKATITEVLEKEVVLETETKEIIRLPKSAVSSVEVGAFVYLSIENEPAKNPRDLLNEILSV